MRHLTAATDRSDPKSALETTAIRYGSLEITTAPEYGLLPLWTSGKVFDLRAPHDTSRRLAQRRPRNILERKSFKNQYAVNASLLNSQEAHCVEGNQPTQETYTQKINKRGKTIRGKQRPCVQASLGHYCSSARREVRTQRKTSEPIMRMRDVTSTEATPRHPPPPFPLVLLST